MVSATLPCLDKGDLEAPLGGEPRGHGTRRAAPDDDDVVFHEALKRARPFEHRHGAAGFFRRGGVVPSPMKKLPIAVALPVTESYISSGALPADIKKVGGSPATYVELRLDYARDVGALDIGTLVGYCRAANLEPICTSRVRAKAQGGNYMPCDQAAHEALLRRMVEARPSLVDVELVNEAELLDATLQACKENGVGAILSLHDFTSTPPVAEVDALCDLLVQAVSQHPPEQGHIAFKVIFTAKNAADNVMPLRVIDRLSVTGRDVVSFCMGVEGLVSRVTSVIPRGAGKAAGKFTFASFGQQTAPGQVDIDTMAALLDPFF